MKSCLNTLVIFIIISSSACTKEDTNSKTINDLNSAKVRAAFHYVGEHYGGGIVFLVDSCGQQGVIADLDDLDPTTWRLGNLVNITGANDPDNGAGRPNTNLIINVQGTDLSGLAPYAALACGRLAKNGFSDWYLPSIYELKAMYKQREKIGGFKKDHYWSSTETTGNVPDYAAWGFNFIDGIANNYYKYAVLNVRAIRYFSVQ